MADTFIIAQMFKDIACLRQEFLVCSPPGTLSRTTLKTP